MNKYNTQLPEIQPPQPPKTDWFSRHHMWGYAFLALAFLLAVAFIYQIQYAKTTDNNRAQVCIQVITPARNPQTGEVKDFPTPCDVPEGWSPVQKNSAMIELPKDVYENKNLGFVLGLPENTGVELELNENNNQLVIFEGEIDFEVRLKNDFDNYAYLDQAPMREGLLDGKVALIFENARGYCDGSGCGQPYISYAVKRGDKYTHLTFYGDTKINDVEQRVIESFKFLD